MTAKPFNKKTRIREKQGRPENPLYYAPDIFDPHSKKTINIFQTIRCHDLIWEEISETDKPRVHPKWIKEAISRVYPLGNRPGAKELRNILSPLLSDLDNAKWLPQARKASGQSPSLVKIQTLSLADPLEKLFEAYNTHSFQKIWASQFPNYGEMPGEVEWLITELIKNGTLSTMAGGKTPVERYQKFLAKLDSRGIRRTRQIVSQLQTFLNYAGYFWNFLGKTSHGLIASLNHFDSYPTWRMANKQGYENKGISKSSLNKEINWLRHCLKWLRREGIKELTDVIEYLDEDFNPQAIQTGKKKEQKPLSVPELKELFKILFKSIGETNHTKTIKERMEIYLGSLWLLLTGCRPSEMGDVTLNADKTHFNFFTDRNVDGKTESAERHIPATKSMILIYEAVDFAIFGQSFGGRLEHYMAKHGKNGINSYRFRHSHASILFAMNELSHQEIVLRMGHRDLKTTMAHYVNLSKYVGNISTEKQLKAFWKTINEFEPMDPGRAFG